MKNMRLFIKSLIAISTLSASIANAGFMPQHLCSNQGGTIEVTPGEVSILLSKASNSSFESYAKLSYDDVNIEEEVIQEMPEERNGCTSRQVTFKKLTITRKDGSKILRDDNGRVKTTSLTDYFICTVTSAWTPRRGQSCN